MLLKHNAEITDLKRRMSSQIIIGTIAEVDHKNSRYRVKSGELLTNWLPNCQHRAGDTKSFSSRDLGEQVIVAAPSGDLAQAVILGAVPTTKTQASDQGHIHTTNYADGSKVSYDHQNHALKAQLVEGSQFVLEIGNGVRFVASGGKLTIDAPEGISVTSKKGLTVNAQKIDLTSREAFAVTAQKIDLTSREAFAVTAQKIDLTSQAAFSLQAKSASLASQNVSIKGGSLTHNGSNIGNSHTHPGVQPGPSVTGTPI